MQSDRQFHIERMADPLELAKAQHCSIPQIPLAVDFFDFDNRFVKTLREKNRIDAEALAQLLNNGFRKFEHDSRPPIVSIKIRLSVLGPLEYQSQHEQKDRR